MPSIRHSLLGCVPVLLALVTGTATAQIERPVCTNRALRTGRLIRVRTESDSTGGTVAGPLVSCADDVLELGHRVGQDSTYRVRTETIQRMWVHDNASRLGLIAGTTAGVVAGAVLASGKSTICFKGSPPTPSTCHGPVVIDALVGGGIGALLGLVVGRALPRWVKVFP